METWIWILISSFVCFLIFFFFGGASVIEKYPIDDEEHFSAKTFTSFVVVALIGMIIYSFIAFKWWQVVLSLPVVYLLWFFGTHYGGKVVRNKRLPFQLFCTIFRLLLIAVIVSAIFMGIQWLVSLTGICGKPVLNKFIWGTVALFTFFVVLSLRSVLKVYKCGYVSSGDDQVVAYKLGISLKRARLYREIFDEQVSCIERGIEPPDRTSEIPNMNEWRRYGEYRENEFSVREVYEKHKSQWDNEKKPMLHSIGETVILLVEGEGDVEGTIIGYEKGFYQVRFPFAVSIMPAKEPEGGWCDNDWPEEIQLLSDGMIDEIKNGILIGTTVHYHF